MQQMVASGQILPQARVWKEGMDDWAPAETIPGIAAAPQPAGAGFVVQPENTRPPRTYTSTRHSKRSGRRTHPSTTTRTPGALVAQCYCHCYCCPLSWAWPFLFFVPFIKPIQNRPVSSPIQTVHRFQGFATIFPQAYFPGVWILKQRQVRHLLRLFSQHTHPYHASSARKQHDEYQPATEPSCRST